MNDVDVVVCCVAEDRDRDHLEVELLFRSLQRFGGALARSRQVAYFVDHVDRVVRDRLVGIGVEVELVAPIDARCPHANKIRMFLDVEDSVDWLVALDTDVVITDDFSRFLTGSTALAKPVDHDPLSMDQWTRLFRTFGLEVPPERYRTAFHWVDTIGYFNSGVLLVPGSMASKLGLVWREFIPRVLDSYADLPGVGAHAFHTDQFALALAFAEMDVTPAPLPPSMNFPTHHPMHKSCRPHEVNPFLLHHHHRVDDNGELLSCGYRGADRAIATVNVEALVRGRA
jgi:hypothetical protein